MDIQLAALRPWRTIALSGTTLVSLGVVADYVDVASHFRFEFIDDHYEVIGIPILIGAILVFVGCIGWARFRGKQHRTLMAGIVFIAPWLAILIGSPIGGTNIHGPAAIVMMLIVPASVLAVILLIMTAFGPREVQ